MDQDEDVRVNLRLPAELHEEIKRWADGNKRRPKASANAAMVFLLRDALMRQRANEAKEIEPGPWMPGLLAA